jgi:hypothetical protein
MISMFWLVVSLIGWLIVSVILRIVFRVVIPQHIQRKIERLHDQE